MITWVILFSATIHAHIEDMRGTWDFLAIPQTSSDDALPAKINWQTESTAAKSGVLLDVPTTWEKTLFVPHLWNDTPLSGKGGFAWYHRRLQIHDDDRDRAAFSLGPIQDAYVAAIQHPQSKQWQIVGTDGDFANRRIGRLASMFWGIPTELIATDGSVELVLLVWAKPERVRAYSDAGGLEIGAYWAGDADAVRSRVEATQLRKLLVGAVPQFAVWTVIMLTGIALLVFYWQRREMHDYLWFGLASFCLSTSQFAWIACDYGLISDFWTTMRFFGHFFLDLACACFLLFVTTFCQVPSNLFERICIGFMVLGGLLQALSSQMHSMIITATGIFLAIGVINIVMRITQAWRRRIYGVRFIALGIGAVGVAALSLALKGNRFVHLPLSTIAIGTISIVFMEFVIVGTLLRRFLRVYADLDQSNARLLRLDKLKDEFLANTSHEMRTPLNGIVGIAESLLDGAAGDLPVRAQTDLSLVVSSGKRLSGLINDLLDFTKMRNQTLSLQQSSVDIRSTVDLVFALLRPLAEVKSLQLINKIPTNIPMIHADENRLQQILLNLIGNAIKFTPSGNVTVNAEQKQKFVSIDVIDTGIGVAPADQERIFIAFEQIDGGDTRGSSGTGLGLAIAKKLVELHGGEIGISSLGTIKQDVKEIHTTPTQGSRFFFTIPVVDKPAHVAKSNSQTALSRVSSFSSLTSLTSLSSFSSLSPVHASLPASSAHKPSIDAHTIHILIVDDEPVNLRVLENHLQLQGYVVHSAQSGEQALSLVDQLRKQNIHIHAAILDVMMPQMSGFTLCEKLRGIFLDEPLPILLLTARNQENDIVAGFTAGASDYILKPFSKEELLARLKTHIRLAQADAAARRFVPFEFLKLLGKKTLADIRHGDFVELPMSVLFADVRSFTTLSEQIAQRRGRAGIFAFVNRFLTAVEPHLYASQGFVNAYLGDGLMALFPEQHSHTNTQTNTQNTQTNTQTNMQSHAARSVVAALHMLKALKILNQIPEPISDADVTNTSVDIFPETKIGVGIHSGPLILGTLGGGGRLDCNVISDTVNLASRVEGMTKIYGAPLLITGDTVAAMTQDERGQFHLRVIDTVIAKGSLTPIDLVEVLDAQSDEILQQKQNALPHFEKARALLPLCRHGDAAHRAEVIQLFELCLQICPHDEASRLHIERCRTDTLYDGVVRLDQK